LFGGPPVRKSGCFPTNWSRIGLAASLQTSNVLGDLINQGYDLGQTAPGEDPVAMDLVRGSGTVCGLGIMQLDASETDFAETQNLFDNVTGLMHKSASFRSVFKSPARFTAPGFVLGAAR